MTRLLKVIIAILIVSVFLDGYVRADWPCRTDSSVAIANLSGGQWNVHLANDTRNGAIAVWQDRRGGSYDKLYIQRMNPAGLPIWQANGLRLAITGGFQYYPQILSDGHAGAFIVWQDNRSGIDYDIYAQHVDGNGVSVWSPNGLLVCGSTGHQYNPQLTSDGAGGIIITWQDRRSGQFDIYAQRVDSSGQIRWQTNGQPVCTDTSNQINPKLIYDGKGGAIVAWEDYRSGTGASDVYSQRILSTGQAAWLPNGLPICTSQGIQWNIQITTDTLGGAIVAWQDRRNWTYDDIYAQRIDQFGNIKWLADGVQVSYSSGTQYYPQMITDYAGGAVIVWQDNRSGADYDIYAQRLNSMGRLAWGSSGLPICGAMGHQYNPQIITQRSYFIVTWQDKRQNDFDIYAQRLNLAGQPLWSMDGNPVATLPIDQVLPQLTIDSANGAIIAWSDYHLNDGSSHIYSQRIGANGLPAGGCYRTFQQDSLAAKALRLKKFPTRPIYEIPNAGNVRDSLFKRGVFPYGLLIGVERLDSAKKFGWMRYTRSQLLKRALPQTAVARPFDYIVDRPFIGEKKNLNILRYNNKLVGELAALKINIAASDAGMTNEGFGDIEFRDTTQLNPLNNKKLRDIASLVDSMLTMWQNYRSVSYSLVNATLQRINGAFVGAYDTISISPMRFKPVKALFSVPFLRASIDQPTPLPVFHAEDYVADYPDNFSLMQNYPNPFNPLTTIEFSIPEQSYVTLKIFNILGQEISTLFDRTFMEDDHYSVDFEASNLSSGVYFYQLLAEPLNGSPTRNLVKKMVLLK